jgi:hypothetical protein
MKPSYCHSNWIDEIDHGLPMGFAKQIDSVGALDGHH